ncbi:uncharacterized protein LOC111692820, partial [Anoplophora glabripennis]|uniref:uncharacterized protein LOC111692820 n=1 Tax=Anoplophora glabripennis TaxID=217634 RepID=UPI000C75A396
INFSNPSKSNGSDDDPKSLVEEIQSPHTEKLIMDHRDHDDDMPRETRGATKDQWVKQVYPVRRREELEDISATPTEKEIVRAPRVHFVTQGMSESSPRPEYTRYDREARARNLNKELSWNLGRDPYRDMEYYYQPRYTRNYMPPSSHSNYRNDRYYNYDSREPYDDYSTRSRYRDYAEKPYDNYNYNNYNSHNNYNGSKGRQRRIVYYATLPEISRTPPNGNLRDRYDQRDRYENRYFSPESSYQMRKPYTKSSYDESDNRKPQYPVKVSTDVNVREVKKNPEGRIYSEVDRNRFPQNSNYRSERP